MRPKRNVCAVTYAFFKFGQNIDFSGPGFSSCSMFRFFRGNAVTSSSLKRSLYSTIAFHENINNSKKKSITYLALP